MEEKLSPITPGHILKHEFLEPLRLVGVRGFEPPTPASRTQCSTRLSYTPMARILYQSQTGDYSIP